MVDAFEFHCPEEARLWREKFIRRMDIHVRRMAQKRLRSQLDCSSKICSGGTLSGEDSDMNVQAT